MNCISTVHSVRREFFQLIAFIFNVIFNAAVRKKIYLVIIVAEEKNFFCVNILVVRYHHIAFHNVIIQQYLKYIKQFAAIYDILLSQKLWYNIAN